jgi:DNA-binding transcriptional LysR family regulator
MTLKLYFKIAAMEDLKRMAIFATVVQQGSMSAAARLLDMSPSAVSQHMRQLERSAGVSLLHRSTRQLTLTDAGQRYYTQCAALCEAARRAQAELAAERQQPSGELRLSAPLGFANHAAPALGAWLGQHPQLRLRLLVDDAPIDLIQARVDLALRFGNQADSSWVARHLGASPTVLCASPQWLAAWNQQAGRPLQALPAHPSELATAEWLQQSHAEHPQLNEEWRHEASGERFALQALPRMVSNHRGTVQHLCEAGLGLAPLSLLDVVQPLREGRLLRLLPDWDMGLLDLWAVTPERDALPAKVRQAVDVLRAYFAQLPGVQPRS